jgi:uncharacterized UBP type Zn finger protein
MDARGSTGLYNVSNTCYLNSVLQVRATRKRTYDALRVVPLPLRMKRLEEKERRF